jgi:hypothetical protein
MRIYARAFVSRSSVVVTNETQVPPRSTPLISELALVEDLAQPPRCLP